MMSQLTIPMGNNYSSMVVLRMVLTDGKDYRTLHHVVDIGALMKIVTAVVV
jgi:hypothetical protein